MACQHPEVVSAAISVGGPLEVALHCQHDHHVGYFFRSIISKIFSLIVFFFRCLATTAQQSQSCTGMGLLILSSLGWYQFSVHYDDDTVDDRVA